MAEFSPMMKQYLETKEKYPDCILFCRLGDFYEMFFDDATLVSSELKLALTGKDCGQEEKAPMCGVPYHAADGYIAKLIKKGYKVAIYEQVEDPKKAKGLVRREVVRVVTPGTILDDTILDEGRNNYIMSVYKAKNGYGLAFADVSTGELAASEYDYKSLNKALDDTAKYNPSEIITNEPNDITDYVYNAFGIKPTVFSDWAYKYQAAKKCLCTHFKTINLEGFGIQNERLLISSAGALLEYLTQTQKNDLSHMRTIKKYSSSSYMTLDISSRRNLELTENMREKSKKGSLLWVIDRTKTAMGARLLRKWIERPLIDGDLIKKRLDAVEQMHTDLFNTEELREYIARVHDVERIISKVIFKTANARDLVSLKLSFMNMPSIKSIISSFKASDIEAIAQSFDTLDDIYMLIDKAVVDEPPNALREGGIIKTGYNAEVDKLRKAKESGSEWIKEIEAHEKEKTGIKMLKIKYNRVFGYFIEITKSALDQVPDSYIRKQTLANCERFIIPELKEVEETILGADEKVVALEYDLFCEIRGKVAENIDRILRTAENIALLDVFQSMADTAQKNGYVKPEISDDDIIYIKNGRHPVVEKMTDTFIPNDIYLDNSEDNLLIITGPNMAGKSTFMRQVAIITLMAQIGSFVPAESAHIGIVDRIFTRVGASDDLATGQSTFMVEMSEVANILNNATRNSLLILDEIGRGTSTYDGLSIAWGVLEHIVQSIGARTLFATHYHELTLLEKQISGVKNYNVGVDEDGDEIVFTRKIVRGSCNRSYGIHVARLAGLPNEVIQRADKVLKLIVGLENPLGDDGLYTLTLDDDGSQLYINETPEDQLNLVKLGVNKFSALSPLCQLSSVNQKLNKG